VADVATMTLKKGSAKPLYAGHPWVFASAVGKVSGAEPGDSVRVVDERGNCIGHALYSPMSAIAARLFTRGDVAIDEALICERIDAAWKLRRELLKLGGDTQAFRLINSEGDGLPGLVVDVYGDVLAVQIGTVGIDRRRDVWLKHLRETFAPRAIMDRSDKRVRTLEGLPPPSAEPLFGTAPAEAHSVLEAGLSFWCDLRAGHGQKTGLFVDQRENRRAFAAFAAGRDVLDLFSFSGGFAVHAAKAGAKSVTLLDSSEAAIELAGRNLSANGIDDADLVCAEWNDGMRHLREKERLFDLIACDPPKFARTQKDVGSALNAYRDLNAQAVRLLRPGGVLFTCSCSGTVPLEEFERAVGAGLSAAGRRAALLEVRSAGADHPVPPAFGQGRYLKCLVLRVD
jgi:23S rRNA (cytosine1962-C5)-methyltransferase